MRIIIAAVFIASGFVKAVDARGLAFKLDEYFSPAVFNLPFLQKFSLPLAIFVIGFELFTGILLLLNIKPKKVLNAMIVLCIFFAFLTFYSAYFNKVTDCGCFGDAVKFTPWQSFFKDLALLVGLIFLRKVGRRKLEDGSQRPINLSFKNLKFNILCLFSVLMIFVIFYGIRHEPLIDFRDYKIGADLSLEKKKINENPSVYKTFYLLKNIKTGEEKSVSQDDFVNDKNYWQSGSPWEIEPGKEKSVLAKEGYRSEISKFKIEDAAGNDLTPEILAAKHAALVFSYHPEIADKNILSRTETVLRQSKNTMVVGVTTNFNTFKTIKSATMDETAIKTVARSNPFVLILQNGKIIDKRSASDYLEK